MSLNNTKALLAEGFVFQGPAGTIVLSPERLAAAGRSSATQEGGAGDQE
jgi:hypothetical protein